MQTCEGKLTVFFESPYWVGVYERMSEGKLEVCKITFGAEPKDYEIYAFLLENGHRLRFSTPIKAQKRPEKKINPKRQIRKIRAHTSASGVGSKAQQAIKQQYAEGKTARKKERRERCEEEKERRFSAKQEKRKQKHRGH